MSTHKEIIDLGMSRLGQRSSTRLRADFVKELNSVIKRLSKQSFQPWFLMDVAPLSFDVDISYAALPDDFVLEVEDTRPFYTYSNVEIKYLTKTFYGMLVGQDTTTTYPSLYAIEGNNLHLRPLFTEAKTVNVLYYKKQDTAIVDDTEEASNLWLIEAEDWVLNMAGSNTARFHALNKELADELLTDSRIYRRDLLVLHEARKHQNMEYIVGGISDGS